MEYSDESLGALKVEGTIKANGEELAYNKLMLRRWEMFEKVTRKHVTIDVIGINRKRPRNFMNLHCFSVLDACIYSPFVVMVSAIGNLEARMDDFSLITWSKSKVKFLEVIEGTTEAFFQHQFSIVFYHSNKAYFECPRNEFFPWFNKGTVLIILIILSIQ